LEQALDLRLLGGSSFTLAGLVGGDRLLYARSFAGAYNGCGLLSRPTQDEVSAWTLGGHRFEW
jgi:hypothetical protein